MALFAFAAALAAQTITVEPGTPPEVATAFEAWAGCVMERVEQDDGEGSAQRAAAAIVAACEDRQRALSAAHDRWVDAQPISASAKRDARRNMARSVAQLRGQIARMIRSMRED
ncbi:MAG TPA: hypothetical protein VF702_07880 [Allosphingosinicella sp.]|jgi:hypothetical protein